MTKTDLYGSGMAFVIGASDPRAAATRPVRFVQIWFSS
jgi:hypothetical protein